MNKKEHITKILKAYKKALKEINPKDSFTRTLAKLTKECLNYGICYYSTDKLGIAFNYKCFDKYKIQVGELRLGEWVELTFANSRDWFCKPIQFCTTKSEIKENLQIRIDILAKELKKCK